MISQMINKIHEQKVAFLEDSHNLLYSYNHYISSFKNCPYSVISNNIKVAPLDICDCTRKLSKDKKDSLLDWLESDLEVLEESIENIKYYIDKMIQAHKREKNFKKLHDKEKRDIKAVGEIINHMIVICTNETLNTETCEKGFMNIKHMLHLQTQNVSKISYEVMDDRESNKSCFDNIERKICEIYSS